MIAFHSRMMRCTTLALFLISLNELILESQFPLLMRLMEHGGVHHQQCGGRASVRRAARPLVFMSLSSPKCLSSTAPIFSSRR